MTLPRWRSVDETNLRRRIERLARARVDQVAAVTVPRVLAAEAGAGCPDCRTDRHRHAAKRVGPFVICRCLACPVLVIQEPDRGGV